jgi:hypothetical protein
MRVRRYWGLSLPDWGVLVAAGLLALSLVLPWLSYVGFTLRPYDYVGVWGLVGVFAVLVIAATVAGRWPYTRWLAVVPLGGGCVLLGGLLSVAGAVLAVNGLLGQLPWQEATELAQTVSRLASLARMPTAEVDRLRDTILRLAAEPQVSFLAGYWLCGLGAAASIFAGYWKIVECFAAPAARHDVPAASSTG